MQLYLQLYLYSITPGFAHKKNHGHGQNGIAKIKVKKMENDYEINPSTHSTLSCWTEIRTTVHETTLQYPDATRKLFKVWMLSFK